MNCLRLGLLAASAAAVCLVPSSLRAGCLAPSDQAIDAGTGLGPFWGNSDGQLLYVRGGGEALEILVLRTGAAADPIAVEGEENGFTVDGIAQSWKTFHTGTINADGDAAFVASTTIADDASTPIDESEIARRGAYAFKGGLRFQIARFGEDSPVPNGLGGQVPWGSVFEAVAADRGVGSALSVVFTGQLASEFDHRIGLFRWSDATPNSSTPILLAGDPSPAGGTFSAVGRLRGNGGGDVAFFATTKLTESSPDTPGIFLRTASGAAVRVVKFGTEGDAAPGGGTFFGAGDFDLDDSGVVTFAATLRNASATSALFRAAPPAYVVEPIVAQGDASPLGGEFLTFSTSAVRAAADGTVVFSAELSDDIGASGVFSVPTGGGGPQPLVSAPEVFAVAPIGGGAAYANGSQVRVVVPEDGTEQGPTDFRIFNLDLRNSAPLKKDTITFEGRLMPPAWEVAPPPVFRSDVVLKTPTAGLTGAQLTKIAEVKVIVSASPGNNFIFGLGGTDALPTATLRYNGLLQPVTKLTIGKDGRSATWKTGGAPGPGTLLVDFNKGVFKLTVSKATINPSYDARNFRVAFILRSADDVAQARPDDASYFHHDFRIDGTQVPFGEGRRVVSKGESVPGGTVYVDLLKVTRKGTTDAVQLGGTLRLCPGSVAVVAPSLPLTLRVGDFHLDAVTMTRVGRSGALYRYAASGVDFRLDLVKGTFTLKAKTSPLTDLVSAAGTTGTNDSKSFTGGMKLPFALTVPLVYDVAFDVPMARLPGGKAFTR